MILKSLGAITSKLGDMNSTYNKKKNILFFSNLHSALLRSMQVEQQQILLSNMHDSLFRAYSGVPSTESKRYSTEMTCTRTKG